jgi:hypothetical protein
MVTAAAAEPTVTNVLSSGRWTNGPLADPAFFPIAVWLQSPANAARYRAAGFNTYVGLWKGPTEEQLVALKKAGLRVVCDQNAVGLRHLNDPTILAWMHGDEPDNAQSLGEGKGYGPPIPPQRIVEDYQRIRAADPSRPVVLNLGQAVAWDGWYGRGVRSNHPEDYPEYLKGCDIVSFDIYPANHDRKEVAGKLWFVAQGVERLVKWSGGEKIIWDCIECTHIGDGGRKPTPHEVRCEVWMSLIHGSRGLIYFVHQFKPTFREAALLDDPEMLAAVTKINRQITELASVLNSPAVSDAVTVQTENANVPIAVAARRHNGSLYVFAVAMRDGETKATFKLTRDAVVRSAEVLGENRNLEVKEGDFTDRLTGWDVHLYRIPVRDQP